MGEKGAKGSSPTVEAAESLQQRTSRKETISYEK